MATSNSPDDPAQYFARTKNKYTDLLDKSALRDKETLARREQEKQAAIDREHLLAESERMTRRIRRIEDHLSMQPWKTEVRIPLSSTEDLCFERQDRGWAFAWRARDMATALAADATGNPKARILLRDASMLIKARATSAIYELIEKMKQEFEERSAALSQAHYQLDHVEARLGLEKGGA